jgi:adenylate cyclase
MRTHYHGLFWFLVATGLSITSHVVGVSMAQVTIGLMRALSDFALQVREHDLQHVPYYNAVTFPGTTLIVLAYWWPVIRYSLSGYAGTAPAVVQRRVLSAPLVTGLLTFAPWLLGSTYFISITVYHFGRWSPELISQHVFSPLVAGFLASTTTYLMVEWITRAQFVPRVFSDGKISAVTSAVSLGVRARLFVLMIAVGFTPLFTMLGLVTAAEDRAAAGRAIEEVLAVLASASRGMFVFYVVLGIGLTLLLARSLARPLARMAATLRQVQAGDLGARIDVTSDDEVGVLEEGVNSLVATLREKERIMQTFGRVVEPSVRDYLLAGNVKLGGEIRTASVLFADLRSFTSLAEQSSPEEIVATLNRFFTMMNGWVRACGGFVDKFIGDAMLVVFGLFEDATDHDAAKSAAAALRSAVGMRDRLAELNAERHAAGDAPLAISIGIHTGEVLAGTIGAEDRHEYTVIGDTVNVAARLQQLCKELGRDLLVSGESFELARAGGFDQNAVGCGTVRLRGRSREVRVFAPS